MDVKERLRAWIENKLALKEAELSEVPITTSMLAPLKKSGKYVSKLSKIKHLKAIKRLKKISA